jgi:hypothetical protein
LLVAAVDSSSPLSRSARTGTDRERPPINRITRHLSNNPEWSKYSCGAAVVPE